MATTETDYNETYGSDAYQAPDSAKPATDAPEYDSGGLLGASVEDINKLTSGSGQLMRGADTRAKQAAQERGLLSSSMAIGAAEAERLNTVMPLVQQQADVRGQKMLQEGQQDWQSGESVLGREHEAGMLGKEQDWRSGESALGREHEVSQLGSQQKHDIVMEGLDATTRGNLVNLEQKWNQDIQQDVNLAAFWQSSIDGLMDIMNNPDLDPDQQLNAMHEMLGYDDENGVFHIGTVEAGLNFLGNLTTNFELSGTSPEEAAALLVAEGGADVEEVGSASAMPSGVPASAIRQPDGGYYDPKSGNSYDSKGNWISD